MGCIEILIYIMTDNSILHGCKGSTNKDFASYSLSNPCDKWFAPGSFSFWHDPQMLDDLNI